MRRSAALFVLFLVALPVVADDGDSRLPFLGEEARKRGIELPPPYGIGLVYYQLVRDIEIKEVRVGRNGAALQPVPDFAQFSSDSNVKNLNLKADVWILPFLNLYAIAGTVKNKSTTNIAIGNKSYSVPTKIDGSVGGLGMTLAGGYKAFFVAGDVNAAQADLGFDDKFKALISSARLGWFGKAGGRPIRVWANATYWDTFATAKGSVVDTDGSTLKFEVDQGPKYPWTYGVGFNYNVRPWADMSVDAGSDFHGGWYIALVPVFRF